MWKTLKTTIKIEWNKIFKMWLKRYSAIKIQIPLRIILLNILTKRSTPQQCNKRIKLKILSTLNHIMLMKNWSKPSFSLFMKEILETISRSQGMYVKFNNTYSEVYGACCHKLRFHAHGLKILNSKASSMFYMCDVDRT